jgi:hypothetical protein
MRQIVLMPDLNRLTNSTNLTCLSAGAPEPLNLIAPYQLKKVEVLSEG